MTISSPSWRSLNLSKRSLNHPKKVTKNCQVKLLNFQPGKVGFDDLHDETNRSWQFIVTFLGWLSDLLETLSDLQLGDEKVTLNHLVPSCLLMVNVGMVGK